MELNNLDHYMHPERSSGAFLNMKTQERIRHQVRRCEAEWYGRHLGQDIYALRNHELRNPTIAYAVDWRGQRYYARSLHDIAYLIDKVVTSWPAE